KADRVKTLQDVVKTLKTISDATKDLEVVTPAALGSEKVTPIDPAALSKTLKTQSATLADQASQLTESAYGDVEMRRLAKWVADVAKVLGEDAEKLPSLGAMSTETKSSRMMNWIDFLTRWGLTVVGLCLLVGFLSRTNAWLGAGFLLMTYL